MDLTTRIQDFEKNKEKDFVKDGHTTKYFGPIYKFEYPKDCDPIEESFDLSSLGFRVGVFSDTFDESFQIPVYGEIPDFFRERLEKAGVKITLEKPRNDKFIEI